MVWKGFRTEGFRSTAVDGRNELDENARFQINYSQRRDICLKQRKNEQKREKWGKAGEKLFR
jgi:hypothetical protein